MRRSMARTHGPHASKTWPSVRVEVSNEIKELMPRRLIGRKGAPRPKHVVFRDDDNTLGSHKTCKASRHEGLDFVGEAKGSRRGNPLSEIAWVSAPFGKRLEPRIAKVDFNFDVNIAQASRRLEGVVALANVDRPRARHAKGGFGRRNTKRAERIKKDCGAAVGERNFGAIEFNGDAFMDEGSAERGEEMLDRRDAKPTIAGARFR